MIFRIIIFYPCKINHNEFFNQKALRGEELRKNLIEIFPQLGLGKDEINRVIKINDLLIKMLQNNSILLERNRKQGIFYLQIPKNKFQDQVLTPPKNKCWNLWVEQVLEVVDCFPCNLLQAYIRDTRHKVYTPHHKDYHSGHRNTRKMKTISK